MVHVVSERYIDLIWRQNNVIQKPPEGMTGAEMTPLADNSWCSLGDATLWLHIYKLDIVCQNNVYFMGLILYAGLICIPNKIYRFNINKNILRAPRGADAINCLTKILNN